MLLTQVLRDLLGRKVESVGAKAEFENPLTEYFYRNPGRGVYRWHHYLEIFHRHLAKYRGRSPVVVEIGVAYGGSLRMWRDYFGPGTEVVGIDVDPACKQFQEAGMRVLIGDQGNRAFLASVREQVPRIDILIDDGGHRMEQQIATFEELYPHIHADGIYTCEDVHTSFWPEFGGGYRNKDTYLEHMKAFIDHLSSWHSDDPALPVDEFARTTYASHFYDSIVVVEKRKIEPPRQFLTHGEQWTPGTDENDPRFRP
jgi:cephalosporin hydroxylase